jgi:voltage-gated potassium channel
MLVLSLFAIVTLIVSTFFPIPEHTRSVLGYADNAICLLFLIDFLITLARAPNRRRYLMTWGWIDLLSSIPAVDAMRVGRAARVLRILRILRGVKATKVLAEFILYRRAQSAFLATLLVSVLLVVVSAAAILHFETSPEANIRTAEDAVWWATVTVTTVGYGDKFPLSSEGRLIAALLMTAGVGMFGAFSGLVAAWFLAAPSKQSAELEAVHQLSLQVADLREELRQTRLATAGVAASASGAEGDSISGTMDVTT